MMLRGDFSFVKFSILIYNRYVSANDFIYVNRFF